MTENPEYRDVSIASVKHLIRTSGANRYLTSNCPLGDFPVRLTDKLLSGARDHPDRIFVACRAPSSAPRTAAIPVHATVAAATPWINITYAGMLQRARAIGQSLLDAGLSSSRPLAILSGNDLEHLQLTFGAMLAGVPVVPLSPAYSLRSLDHVKLRGMLSLIRPGMIYAADHDAFATTMRAVGDLPADWVTREPTHRSLGFDALIATSPSTIDQVHGDLTGQTLAKILFTSGSTTAPKAVPTTHRMLCSNQQMLVQSLPAFAQTPPVLVDWLPWHHTYGGSHNVGIVLYNGGTLYIDEGRPVAGQFDATLRNLMDVSPTAYFNVPLGWEAVAGALERNDALRERFFARVALFFSGGAGLSQPVRDRLDRVAQRHGGKRIRIISGLGMTETSPCSLLSTGTIGAAHAASIGLPVPGCEVKLAPVDGRFELRFRGPHVMTGYGSTPSLTASHAAAGMNARTTPDPAVFDDEGFFRSGDAAVFVDAARPDLGLLFDGRLADNFKLNSGTTVAVGLLRERALLAGSPYLQDVTVTGIGHAEIGMLIFPQVAECRRLAALPPTASLTAVVQAAPVRAFFRGMLARLNATATGSASFVARIQLMDVPASPELGEMTDKGSINAAMVRFQRAVQIDALHAALPDDRNIIAATASLPVSL